MSNARLHAMALLENPRLHARTRTALFMPHEQPPMRRVSLNIRRLHSALGDPCQPCRPFGSHLHTGPVALIHHTRW